jgi:hypothetical protein
MKDAARWPMLQDVSSTRARAPNTAPGGAPASTWNTEPGALSLLLDASEIQAMVAEAAAWAERIAVCVTAPQSERGTHPWWMELLARSTKCTSIQLRRAEQTERWLLHRLHETGRLRLVEGGGKNVASNLLSFSRGDELRVLLSHIPLDRAVLGAQFGALLSFRGRVDDGIARACRAQLDSWAEHGRIPAGGDIDALAFDPRRKRTLGLLELPPGLSPVTDPAELGRELEVFLAGAPAGSVTLRAAAGGFRVTLEPGDAARAPYVLTLQSGAGQVAGNTLLLRSSSGARLLVWRGGLLGTSVSKAALCWSEARLESFQFAASELGGTERVALVARSETPLGPQLGVFAQEVGRLCEAFAVEPSPPIGHVLPDFATLSAKQRTLLVYRSLLGAGALAPDAAAALACTALRDLGYLRGGAPEASLLDSVHRLILEAADAGRSFDRPAPDRVRAIQPELGAYTAEDWLECLLRALPEQGVVTWLVAVRLAYEHARSCLGLSHERLRPGGAVERAIERALTSALRRGLCARVGANGIVRLGALGANAELAPIVDRSAGDCITGWARALESLAPVQRFILSRRVGFYGQRETLDSIAQRLGISTDRARQLELEGWQQVEAGSGWAAAVRNRLWRALAGTRVLPVRRLVKDDAFWRGLEARVELAEGMFETLLEPPVFCVVLGAGARREAFFADFEQAALDRVFEGLLERAAAVATPAPVEAYAPLCEAAAAELDASLTEPLRQALEARLGFDELEPDLVLGMLPNPSADIETFPLEPRSVDSEALLRLEDVLRSVFRVAGTPLSLSSVAERVKQRIDVEEALLLERLPRAPFVQRNADQYGLLSRDVPGGAEAIALVLNDVAEALSLGQRGLGPEALTAIAQARVAQAWSPELVRSLVASDPALYLSPALHATLRRWEHTRLLPHGALLCPGVPASMRPRFDRLVQQPCEPEDVLGRRLLGELARLERSTDADDVLGVPLARQLCDLALRLLALADAAPTAAAEASVAAKAPAAGQPAQLAHAAVVCLLDALAPDEDDPDAPAVDTDAVSDARAVFAAVLRWLELDWLD